MRMTDDELRALTDSELRNSVGYWSGKLATQRQQAMYYYLGEAVGDLSPPEIEGRSSVVSPDVRNTIESMLPQLMVKFAGSDHPVEFEATKPGDEPKAEQATDYISYLYNVKNGGEKITYHWMKDALLSKNGIVKVWWDTRAEQKREEYVGLDAFELAQIADDAELEIIAQKSYPDEEDAKQRQEAIEKLGQQLQQATQAAQQGDQQAAQAVQVMQQQIQQIQAQPPKMLFDIDCKRTLEKGRIRVENVPPEEFLIARKAKNIQEASFVGHRVARTLSELRSMGYKDVENIGSDDASTSFNMERIQRLQWDDEQAANSADFGPSLDEAQRMVWVTECYIRCDYDGDGIVELRKVVRAGSRILENEMVDCAPFVSICPIPLPHKFFGLSIADLSIPAQKTKTSILRGMLDNMYLQINGRYFAVDGQVNLDDLTTSRPGGVVRMKQPGMAGRLDQGMGDSNVGMGMMEYMQGFLEDSTGWTRYNQGADGDSLNQTATGVNQIVNRADMRLDLIARNFAEGFRELFRMMLKLVSQYQQKEQVVKLRGQWVPVNPRDWRHGFETTINVGLGTGSKDQLVAQLNMLAQHQQTDFPLGIVTPKHVFELKKELTKAIGFKNADRFFADPSNGPQQPEKPDPEQIKAQSQMQIEQAKAQAQMQVEQAKIQANRELEQFKAQLQAQVDQNRQEQEARQHAMKVQVEAEAATRNEAIKAEMEAARRELDKYKADLSSQTAIYIKQLELSGRAQEVVEEPEGEELTKQDMLQVISQGIQQLSGALSAPKRVVRDPMGRAVGVESVPPQV